MKAQTLEVSTALQWTTWETLSPSFQLDNNFLKGKAALDPHLNSHVPGVESTSGCWQSCNLTTIKALRTDLIEKGRRDNRIFLLFLRGWEREGIKEEKSLGKGSFVSN